MVRFITAIIFINLSLACAGQEKFIELKDHMSILEKNEKLNYSLRECNLLEQFDKTYYKKSVHKKIILTTKYENIEELITNLDKNILRYLNNTYGIAPGLKDAQGREIEIDFPVLKYENRVFIYISSTYAWHNFIIELKKPRIAKIALVQFAYENPVFDWELTLPCN